MPITGKFRAGKTSAIQVANNNLNHNEYSITDKAEYLDTTNFEDNGYGERLVGIREAEFSLKGDWDALAPNFQPYGDPPGLFPRDDGGTTETPGNLVIFTSLLDGAVSPGQNSWNFPLWGIGSSKVSSTTRGKVTFEADGMSNGPYADPSGQTKSPATN